MKRREHTGNHDAVGGLVASASIEVIPVRGVEQVVAAIPTTTTVTITCSPKLGVDRTLERAELAARAGHRVVPHIAARQVSDEAELRRIVERLDAVGIRNLYVVGGDAAAPAGTFASSAALIEALATVDHHLDRIGVACYPEGHPEIPDAVLLEDLRRKQAHAHYMVSQLCFDVEALLDWLHRVRAAGIELPLRIGLAAPMNARKLAELSMKIGVGSSVRYLTKQHNLVGNVLRGHSYRPQDLLYAIGDDLTSDQLRIEGLHLFSFNQIAATVAWQRQLGANTAAPAA